MHGYPHLQAASELDGSSRRGSSTAPSSMTARAGPRSWRWPRKLTLGSESVEIDQKSMTAVAIANIRTAVRARRRSRAAITAAANSDALHSRYIICGALRWTASIRHATAHSTSAIKTSRPAAVYRKTRAKGLSSAAQCCIEASGMYASLLCRNPQRYNAMRKQPVLQPVGGHFNQRVGGPRQRHRNRHQ